MMAEPQTLTSEEVEQAKAVARSLFPDVNIDTLRISIMPKPTPNRFMKVVEGDTVVPIVRANGYQFAFHSALNWLLIGKDAYAAKLARGDTP